MWYEHNLTLIRRSCLACSTRLSSALFFWSVFWSWQWIFSLQREAKQRHQDMFFLSTSDLRVSFRLVYFPNDYCRWLWTKASFDPGIHVVRYSPFAEICVHSFLFSHNDAYNSRSINIFDVSWFAVSLKKMNWLVVRMDFRSLEVLTVRNQNKTKGERNKRTTHLPIRTQENDLYVQKHPRCQITISHLMARWINRDSQLFPLLARRVMFLFP